MKSILTLGTFLLATASLILPSVCQASINVTVNNAFPRDGFQVGLNSSVSLTYSESNQTHTGVFLGKLVQPDGTFSKYMLLDEATSIVYLSDQNDTSFSTSDLETILRQYDQVDGTCTGYAIDHLMQQMHWSGFTGNGTLATTLSTEYGRTQLLVTSIDDYYLATEHRNSIEGILNQLGTGFDFKCEKKMFQDTVKATTFVEYSLATGFPILISFNIGPQMVNSDLVAQDYESRALSDRRLWIPRKTGERNSGGHSVVAVGEFMYSGKKKLLMLDSDWAEPRVWDLEQYLGDPRVAIQEIEFYSCK
jgi:hypothetical protein